jgi:DNA-binding transcriptional ArsR family regulator
MPPARSPALALVYALDDPLRYAVLSRLVAGPATVSELVSETGASQAKMSNHLAILREHALVTCERAGRYVAYALAGPHVADIIERIDAAAGHGSHVAVAVPELALARRCYDHLAGRLGVAIFASLVADEAIRPIASEPVSRAVRTSYGDVELARRAERVFAALDVDLDRAREERRRFAIACNDWTEAQPHLAGALGAALMRELLRKGWLQRRSGTRALRITAVGRAELVRRFGTAVSSVLT